MQLWKGEWLRSRQRGRTALRRALLYRWRAWRTYLSRYKATECEDMDNELDLKLESLAKLQVLLQAHTGFTPQPSPKNADAVTMTTGADRSSKVTLTPVNESTHEGTEEATATTGLAGDTVTEVTAAAVSAVDSLKTSVSAKNSFVGAPPMSPAPLNRASSGKFLRERSTLQPVFSRTPTAPAIPLSAREIKKQQEAKLTQRKQLMVQVDSNIRNTLSAFSLPVGEVKNLTELFSLLRKSCSNI